MFLMKDIILLLLPLYLLHNEPLGSVFVILKVSLSIFRHEQTPFFSLDICLQITNIHLLSAGKLGMNYLQERRNTTHDFNLQWAQYELCASINATIASLLKLLFLPPLLLKTGAIFLIQTFKGVIKQIIQVQRVAVKAAPAFPNM